MVYRLKTGPFYMSLKEIGELSPLQAQALLDAHVDFVRKKVRKANVGRYKKVMPVLDIGWIAYGLE